MPTIVGIGFVILAIALTTFIVKSQTNLKSKASNSEEPHNVKVTNLSDNSFTLTYQTDAATTGSVNYGQSKELGNTGLEDLDKEKGNFSSKNIHSITVRKLTPATNYHLVIVSGQNTFLNNGTPFEIATAPTISSPSATKLQVKGKVILPDGNVPQEALIYLSTKNSQLLSSVVGKNGEFNFSLDSLRSEDLNSYFKLNAFTSLELTVISNSLKSTVFVSVNEADSIPTITLSNNYDFTNDFAPIASKSAESKSISFPAVTIRPESLKPQILSPKKDQSFTDQRPQFRGTGLPNENVQITIHSTEQIQAQVKADSNGNWTYRPPSSLSPGEHTITIQTRDAAGILTTLVQSFTVFAAGTQVSESATPSATPFPSPTIIVLTPTVTPTPFPTGGPSPTPIPIGSKGGLPPTGDSPILLILGGIVTTVSGIVLFLLTHSVL